MKDAVNILTTEAILSVGDKLNDLKLDDLLVLKYYYALAQTLGHVFL